MSDMASPEFKPVSPVQPGAETSTPPAGVDQRANQNLVDQSAPAHGGPAEVSRIINTVKSSDPVSSEAPVASVPTPDVPQVKPTTSLGKEVSGGLPPSKIPLEPSVGEKLKSIFWPFGKNKSVDPNLVSEAKPAGDPVANVVNPSESQGPTVTTGLSEAPVVPPSEPTASTPTTPVSPTS